MVSLGDASRHRIRIFFFLILSVAVLWAVFLLQRGEMLQFLCMFAALAAINPIVAFIELKNQKNTHTLFIFYILIVVALIWAIFLFFLGVLLWVSIFIFIVAVGIPFLLHVMEAESAPSVQ